MKNENSIETTNIEIKDAPEGVQVNIETKAAPKAKAKKTTDAEKINLLEKAAKKAGNDLTVTIAAKSKKSPVKKAAPKAEDAKPKADSKKAKDPKVEPEKVDLSKVAPLTVPKELLTAKMEKLSAKLEKEKLTVTKSPFHVSYGFFLCRTKSGKTLRIEFHEGLKSKRWLLRDDEGKVLTEPEKTMHGLHQIAVNQF